MFVSVQIGNLTFNNSDQHYWITGTQGLGSPPIREIDYDVPGENFGLFVSALYGGRAFSLSGTIVGDSIADLANRRDKLAASVDITNGEQVITFTLPNGLIKQITAICTGIDFSPAAGNVNSVDFQMQFKASFPYFLSPSINQYQVGLPIGGGGSIPPPTMPAALGGNSGGSVAIVNNGNARYWPMMRIYGPVINPQILNKAQNLSLQLTITLATGQYLDINFKRKSIFDNFGTNQYSAKNGDWWWLDPGQTVIAFSAASFSSSALCVIFAQDAYLNV